MSFRVHRIGRAVLCAGAVPRLNLHTPHAVTLCVAGEGGEVLVRFAFDPRWHSCAAAILAPGLAHELDGRGTACTLFLGPETYDGRRFREPPCSSTPPPPSRPRVRRACSRAR